MQSQPSILQKNRMLDHVGRTKEGLLLRPLVGNRSPPPVVIQSSAKRDFLGRAFDGARPVETAKPKQPSTLLQKIATVPKKEEEVQDDEFKDILGRARSEIERQPTFFPQVLSVSDRSWDEKRSILDWRSEPDDESPKEITIEKQSTDETGQPENVSNTSTDESKSKSAEADKIVDKTSLDDKTTTVVSDESKNQPPSENSAKSLKVKSEDPRKTPVKFIIDPEEEKQNQEVALNKGPYKPPPKPAPPAGKSQPGLLESLFDTVASLFSDVLPDKPEPFVPTVKRKKPKKPSTLNQEEGAISEPEETDNQRSRRKKSVFKSANPKAKAEIEHTQTETASQKESPLEDHVPQDKSPKKTKSTKEEKTINLSEEEKKIIEMFDRGESEERKTAPKLNKNESRNRSVDKPASKSKDLMAKIEIKVESNSNGAKAKNCSIRSRSNTVPRESCSPRPILRPNEVQIIGGDSMSPSVSAWKIRSR